MRTACSCLLVFGSALGAVTAQTVTLQAKEVLRVHFHVTSAPSPTPDVLSLGLGIVTVNAAHTTRTAQLWNCDTLLGTAAASSFGSHVGALSLGVANSWTAPGSPYTFGTPGLVGDFSSIQSGTIRGIIDFRLATGSITLDLSNVTLRLIRASHSSGGNLSNPQPTIDEAVVVPALSGPAPGTVGPTNPWTTSGGTPGNAVLFMFGVACNPVVVPCIPPVYLDVNPPLVFIPRTIDPRCNAFLQFPVPASASGVTILTQAAEIVGSSCRISNFTRHTFP